MKVNEGEHGIGSLFIWNTKYFKVKDFPQENRVHGIEISQEKEPTECVVHISLVEWI